MDNQWLFQCDRVNITPGMLARPVAKSGFLGIRGDKTIILFDDAGQIIDQAPAAQCEVNFVKMTGHKYVMCNMNGHKWSVGFDTANNARLQNITQSGGILAAGFLGGLAGMAASQAMGRTGSEQKQLAENFVNTFNWARSQSDASATPPTFVA